MPQFDFQHVFWPQVAWLAVSFAILYFGVVRMTLPKLGRVMQEREDKVIGDLDAAEAAKTNADSVAAEYAADLAEAHQKARARVVEAQNAAARAVEGKLAESGAVVEARLASAEAELNAARVAAMTEIEDVAADAASDIVEKLTGARPPEADAAAAARAALA